MTLSALIRKRDTGNLATAIPAIFAIQPEGEAATVARIATVAVAKPWKAKSEEGNSSKNSNCSSSNPHEQQTEKPAIVGDAAATSRWLIHFPDRDPLTVAFSPAVSYAEVLDACPAELAAEPIESGRRQPDALLAGDQEAAILAWLSEIGESDQAIVAEVLRQCRQDEGAREYYLGRAGYAVTDDDRRCCSQCDNLRGAVCIVAKPGGLVSAIRSYRPASPGVLQRCAGYSPNASDTDQRVAANAGRD